MADYSWYLGAQYQQPIGAAGLPFYLGGTYALPAGKQATAFYLGAEFKLPVAKAKAFYLGAEYQLPVPVVATFFINGQHALPVVIEYPFFLGAEYALAADTVYYALAANLRTGAHSSYQGFAFNSLSGGYGCKADGLYLLEGATDGGVAIDCILDIGKTDFQDDHLKRMTDAYIGMKSDGNVSLNVVTENSDATYTVTPSATLETNKINLGRGAIGRYWQLILQNVSGSSFVVDSIEVMADILSRRARGRAVQATVVNPVPELGTCCNDIEMPFSWGDATPAKIVTVPAGKTVFKVQVVMLTVFNGDTVGLTIGDSGDVDRLLAAENISLYDLATYETNPNHLYASETDVNLYITVDGSNSQGSGVILIELKD